MEDNNSSGESQNFRDLCMMGGTNLPCTTITNVCKISVFIIKLTLSTLFPNSKIGMNLLDSTVISFGFPELSVNTALLTISCFQVPAMVTESISSISTTTEENNVNKNVCQVSKEQNPLHVASMIENLLHVASGYHSSATFFTLGTCTM